MLREGVRPRSAVLKLSGDRAPTAQLCACGRLALLGSWAAMPVEPVKPAAATAKLNANAAIIQYDDGFLASFAAIVCNPATDPPTHSAKQHRAI